MTATMYEKKDRKKFPWLLALLVLSISMLVGGIYLLVNGDYSLIKKTFTYDKYSDVISLCNEDRTDSTKPIFNCKALLTNITTKDDGSSCFDIQIITPDSTLKTVSICEKGSTLSYTNEILSYKKLMPIDIKFTYSLAKSSIFKDEYTFSNVSFTKMDEIYIEGIINEDISNLVTLDPNNTTIKNSVDFCPNPSKLPDYVTDANKEKYTEFFNKNIMPKEEYLDSYLYSGDDSTIRILFACDSAENMGYTDICNFSKNSYSTELSDNIYTDFKLENTLESNELSIIKEISLIYDKEFLINENLQIPLSSNFSLVTNVISTYIKANYHVINSLYKLYLANELQYRSTYNTLKNKLEEFDTYYYRNIIDTQVLDKDGLFIYNQYMTSTQIFNIYDKCTNLNNFLK